METPTHVIDPDGEIIIVLKDANPPFSVWVENCEDETGTGVKNGEGNGNGEKPDQSTGDQQPATDDVVKEDVKEETFRILVSAKHLTLASPVWKKMFTGSWKESAVLLQNGSIELTVYSWDLEALLLLLNIIHCKHQALPPSPDLKLLARMGIIADYYACSDAVKFMVKAWIGPFTSPPPSSQEEVMLWIWISWAFELSSDFTASTSFHLTHAKTPIKNLGIPIPSNIIDAINQQREQAIQKILDNLQSTRNDNYLINHETYVRYLTGLPSELGVYLFGNGRGKVFSQFEVKTSFLVSAALFEVGSARCGPAPTMNALIVRRTLCGLGSVGIYIGAINIISISTIEPERPGYFGFVGLTCGVGTVLGPITGGAFADSDTATWRWSFHINLCVGAVAGPIYLWLIKTHRPRPGLSLANHLKQLDIFGATLMVGAFVSGIMAISFGCAFVGLAK
ncbi:hypothetical protein ZTR_07867 [Talaromyces verruculosus]|nr:hypothetical protein ZTR_07867 [Talaromyces verruculosus]